MKSTTRERKAFLSSFLILPLTLDQRRRLSSGQEISIACESNYAYENTWVKNWPIPSEVIKVKVLKHRGNIHTLKVQFNETWYLR